MRHQNNGFWFYLCHHFHSMKPIWFDIHAIFSCDQSALCMNGSVRPSIPRSVRLSVTPFSPCSIRRIIMKISAVITNDISDAHAKYHGQRSKVKVTEMKTPLVCFRIVTPVWIHIWRWNDAQSLMWLRRGVLLFFKVIRQILWSHRSNNRRFWPELKVSVLQLQFEFTDGFEMVHEAWSSIAEVSYCFSMSSIKCQGQISPILTDCNSKLKKSTIWIQFE